MLQPNPNAGHALQPALALLTRPAVLPLAIFAWLAATAWLRPLSLPDEGRYVGVALEMLFSGNWLVPTLDTLPYFHKPPLFYWMTAASMATLGINEWAARLCSLLAATGCALGLYRFLARWAGEDHARLALLVLLTTPFFYGGAQFANLDMLVTACITGTILCAAHAVLASDAGSPPRAALAGAYLLAALGLLAKGLIGLVIPAMVIGIWLVVIGRPRMILRLFWLPGVALFAVIALPWFVAMQAQYPGFANYFFLHHHFERFTTRSFNSHRPFWFLVVVYAGAALPWFVFLFAAVRRRGSTLEVGDVPRQVRALMWIWLVATLVFFSIPNSKLLGYVLVAVPPLGALAAEGLTRIAGTPARVRFVAMRVAAVAALVCAAMLIGVTIRDRGRDNTRALAATLAPLVAPADPLLVLHDYPFSLPFYLRRPPPLPIVELWQRARTNQKDSWRRELYEAAEFAPARGKSLMLEPEALRTVLGCSSRTIWLIVPSATFQWLPPLPGLQRITQVGDDAVWRHTPASASDQPPSCAP